MFDTIFSILRSEQQPWLPKNLHDDRHYQQLVNDTELIPCSNPLYRLDIHDVMYVPPMAQYYQRLVGNELNSWLNNQWAEKCLGLTDNQIRYRHSIYSNVFDELLNHTDQIIHNTGYSYDSVAGRNVSYQTDAQAKICTLICYYIQAALVITYLTWQDYFHSSLPPQDIFDSPEQLAFHFLKHALPENIAISNIDEIVITPEESSTATTVAQRFINTVAPYQFLMLPKLSRLSPDKQIYLIEKIVKDAAWAAAMLEHLGYHARLKGTYHLPMEKIYSHCAEALDSKASTYKKYVLSLHNPASPSYEKHNASIHIKDVEDFYNKL